MIQRDRSSKDRREVLLKLTRAGDALLRELTTLHRKQLQIVAPHVVHALHAILEGQAGPE